MQKPCYTVVIFRSGVLQDKLLLTPDQWLDLGRVSEIDLDEYSGTIELALMNIKHQAVVVH